MRSFHLNTEELKATGVVTKCKNRDGKKKAQTNNAHLAGRGL